MKYRSGRWGASALLISAMRSSWKSAHSRLASMYGSIPGNGDFISSASTEGEMIQPGEYRELSPLASGDQAEESFQPWYNLGDAPYLRYRSGLAPRPDGAGGPLRETARSSNRR